MYFPPYVKYSLVCSQAPATEWYPQQDESILIFTPHSLGIHPNTFPLARGFPLWYLPFTLSNKNF